MTVTKKVRWNCPNDKHPGVLASTRPPKNSIVRYCLLCSQETGLLVERIAPALKTKRAASAATTAAKAKAKRVRAAAARQRAKEADEAKYFVEGVDLRKELMRVVKLPAFGGRTGKLAKCPPALMISLRHSHFVGRLGYAEPWQNRITVAVYPGQTLIDALHTLVHELTHIAVGSKPQSTGTRQCWHGPEFRVTLAKAWKQSYGPEGRYTAILHKEKKVS